jgi:hypothetical protein
MSKKTKSPRKSRKVVAEDVKKAAAHDVPEVAPNQSATAKTLAPNASPVQRGIYFNGLAGVKDKHAVIAVFTKAGYSAYSWDKRAEKLGISTEELCERFRTNPDLVKTAWAALPKPERKKKTTAS